MSKATTIQCKFAKMRQHQLKTGELSKRLQSYGINFSKRKLERMAQSGRLPDFLYVRRSSEGGHYQWDWLKTEKQLRSLFFSSDVDFLADRIQSEYGGDVQRIKTKVSRLLRLVLSCGVPYFVAFRFFHVMFSISPEEREEMAKKWEQEVAPRMTQEVSERIKSGGLSLLADD